MFTVSIGNSYKIFPNILLMSSILRLAQSVGITGVWYLSSSFLARLLVYSEYGSSVFKTITKGLLISFNSFTTRSSALM